LNKWVYLTWVHTGGKLYAYKDGVFVNSTTLGNLAGGMTHLVTFGNNYLQEKTFNGTLDDIRVYNRALSASEVKQLYNMGAGTKVNASATAGNSFGLSSGLVGYWTFDSKDLKNNVADRSKQGNTGYMQGFTSTSSAVTVGKIGQGLKFDGVDDYVNAKTGSILNITGQNITISAWINPKTFGGGTLGRIVNKHTTTDSAGYAFFLDSSNTTNGLSFAINDSTSGNGNIAVSVANIISLGKWQHVVAVYNGSGVSFYVNGIKKVSNAYNISGKNISDNSTLPFYIGGRSADALRQFNGSLDDIRVYNRALSASEVKQIYNMGR
jgi:hypothetical protein